MRRIITGKHEQRAHTVPGATTDPGFAISFSEQMVSELEKAGIDCTLILDTAIGYVMETVDMVLVGAEGVVESGGIINRIGTVTMAICAREMKKPFYALVESFKFCRLYPLNQRDLPNEYKVGFVEKIPNELMH